MTRPDPATYGDRIAGLYDETFPHDARQTDASIERVAELAKGGPILELGIGTGRVTAPLAERGLEVHGIEASPAMVEKLRAKPGGDRVQVTVGDIGTTDVEQDFALVMAIGDTLSMLATQDEQMECVKRFAGRLREGGVFVVEGAVKRPASTTGAVTVLSIDTDEVHLVVTAAESAGEELRQAHVILGRQGTEIIPVVGRHLAAAELDLMARLAGLRLRERWGSWEREPFGPQSRLHVSVYERR